MLQKLEQFPLKVQQAEFRSCLTDEMITHIKCAVNIDNDSELSIKEILDQIQAHFRQKRNVALDQVAFEQRVHESFDEFYVAVKQLAEEADICPTCKDQRITTKIMASIKNSDLRQKLLAITPFPTLQSVVDLCRSQETAMKDAKELSKEKVHVERVIKTKY